MASTNPARGMRDFLPADVRKREYVIGIIKQVYESYGFEPLETPALENIETLMGKYGEEGNQLIFKILKRGEKLAESLESLESRGSLGSPRSTSETSQTSSTSKTDLVDLALRYDLTVPLARVVANRKNDLPKFFKRYQIQPVWRADRPARGRFREFYQCDVDVIGSDSVAVESEIIIAVNEILTMLGFTHAQTYVNDRNLLFALLDVAGVPPNEQARFLVELDKYDKIGFKGIWTNLEAIDINPVPYRSFFDLLRTIAKTQKDAFEGVDGWKAMFEVNTGALNQLSEYVADNPNGLAAVNRIRKILDLVFETRKVQRVLVMPFLARGLSYYTGTIFEIDLRDPTLPSSAGGGGRYDGLIGMFGKEQIPACGFSLGLERILVVMEERGMFDKPIAEGKLKLDAADVMVTIFSEETVAESLKLASDLRASGLRVTLYPEADKLGKQLKYADSIRVPSVCVLGESEIAEGKVTLKNMRTGEQETIVHNEVAARIANQSA